MSAPVCPYLGLLDNPESFLNYSSFENRCYATVARESIPLSEQAVFCLGGQHRSCPRYMALHGAPVSDATVEITPLPEPYTPAAAGYETAPLPVAYAPVTEAYPASGRERDWSLAIILGGILAGVFVCVALFSGYLSLRALVTTALPRTPTPVAIVVITLTPTPTSPFAVIPTDTTTPTTTSVFVPIPTETVFLPIITPVPVQPTLTPTPFLPIELTFTPELPPTRRPSPTVTPNLTITPLPTVTGTPGAVVISFTSSRTSVTSGQCVTNSWTVQNARQVFYQNISVAATGSREECPTATTTYTLRAVDDSGASTTKTVMISVISGTPTGTITPTYTPTSSFTRTPTPTWTPNVTPTPTPSPTPTASKTPTPTSTNTPTATVIPTDTPTPTSTPFFVVWDASPNEYSGSGPEVSITFTNRGSGPDRLRLVIEGSLPAGWQAEICASGSCGTVVDTASTDVNASVSATVRFTIPGDAASGSQVNTALIARSLNDTSERIVVPIIITKP